jgi:hypothetical protein
VDAGCKSLISICFLKIAGAPIGSPQFWGSKEESMACVLRRYGVTDSGKNCRNKQDIQNQLTAYSKQSLLGQVYWDRHFCTVFLSGCPISYVPVQRRGFGAARMNRHILV